MINSNILAGFALLVSTAANAAEIYNTNGNKLDLYGKVHTEHDFITSSKDSKNSYRDLTYTKIGLKGETKINDQLTGYGQLEYNLMANQNLAKGRPTNKNNLTFAGIKAGNAGSIDYGRNYSIFYDVKSYTDIAPSYSGMTWGSNLMTNYNTGLLTYRNKDFFGIVDGLSIGVQYQGKNDSYDVNTNTSNGDGFGYSLGYDFCDDFSVIASYSKSKAYRKKEDGNGSKAEAWGLGGKYDANNLYLATTYAEISNANAISTCNSNTCLANKTHNFEVVAQYQFDFGLRPAVSYVQTKGLDLMPSGKFTGGNADLRKFVQVGATYYFNKNLNVWADYYINLLNKDKYTDSAQYVGSSININGPSDMAAVGVTYQF